MKKLFVLLAASMISMGSYAQYQLTNSDFEEWETVKYTNSKQGEEPVKWSSFLDGTGSLKGTAAAQQLFRDSEVRPGSKGKYSARITSRSVIGVVAQGNLTNGCVNMGSMSATDASGNYNYINEKRSDQSMRFSGHPDAARVWVRYSGVKTGNVSLLLTTKGYFQDPKGNNITATLVAHATNSNIASNDKWTEYTIPFVVDDATAEPYYCLTNVSTCAVPGAGNADDYLYIDDLELLYYSEATSITYAGQEVLKSGSYDGPFDPSQQIEVQMTGRAATWDYSFDYNKYELTITVKGENFSEDASNKHSYVIKFVKPNADLSSATQDGVDLLQDASEVIYDASTVELTYNDDVKSHTESFDINTCQLTIVMKDALDNSITRVIQFHKPAPAIIAASWKGEEISVEDFETGDVYDEAELVLTANNDATLKREFDEKSLVLTVTAFAPTGYEQYNKVYTLQFGMGEMLDPSKEEIFPVDLVRGNKYYVVNKKTGLRLTDKDILGTDLTEWTIDAEGNMKSQNGKYVSVEVIGNSGLLGNANVKNVNLSTSKTETTSSTALFIDGDKSGYTFSMTAEWSYGLWSSSSYTAYLGTSGTFLTYTNTPETDEYKWLLYDVDSYLNRQLRIQLYEELQRAELLGLNINAYRQTLDKNKDDNAVLKNLLGTIRQDEASFVEARYTLDKAELLGGTVLSDKNVWTTTMVENYGGQHWSGKNLPYYEQTGNQWEAGNWAVSAEKQISLPAGKYVLKATARSSALATAYMEVNGKQLLFPANGDTGLGVDTEGNVNYSTSGTYANNNIGRGWEYRYLQFDMPEAGFATIKIGGSAEAKYQWLSISDMYLMAQPVPELKVLKFSYEGTDYTFEEDKALDLTDVYYKEEILPEVTTAGYGVIECAYDSTTWQMTVTLRQEPGINYGLEDRAYTVQFHKADPALTTFYYDDIDLLVTDNVDQFYNASKLVYTSNEDAQNVTVTFDRLTSILTVKVEGYGLTRTYEVTFRDASAVSTAYTEPLVVTVNEDKTEPEDVTVILRKNEDDTYDFELPNFMLNLDGEEMPIGTIVLTGIKMEDLEGINTFSITQDVNIAVGDKEGISTGDWFGPWLGSIPVRLTVGQIYAGRMYVHIDIDMTQQLEQVIAVDLGAPIITTGVTAAKADSSTEDAAYNLAGQRINAQKGIVIKNGKKVVLK